MGIHRFRKGWRAEVFVNSARVASKADFPTKAAAAQWHAAQMAQYLRGERPEKAKPATFSDAVALFRERHLPTVRIGPGRDNYERYLRLWIEPHFRYLRLSSVTAGELDAFRSKLLAELEPSTAKNVLAVATLVLKKAHRWQLMGPPPAATPIKVPQRSPRFLGDPDHVRAFLVAARGSRYWGLFAAAVTTGMRLGELLGLTIKDVDFSAGVIRVERQWVERLQDYGPPKGGRPRAVTFETTGECAAALRKAVARAKLEGRLALFTTATGRIPRRSKIGDYLSSVCLRAKVPAINPHGLRHTFASWYWRTTGDAAALRDLLGHADWKTFTTYVHRLDAGKAAPLKDSNFFTHNSRTNEGSDNRKAVNSQDERNGAGTLTRTVDLRKFRVS